MDEQRRWEEMPVDCLVAVFRRLGLDDLSVAVPFVCKSWLRASMDPGCWKVLNFHHLDFLPWSSFARRFMARHALRSFSFSGFMKVAVARSHGSAVELRFPPVFGASLQDLVYASIKCPRLRILSLPDLTLADEAHIPEMVGKWKDLERLEMGTKPSTFSTMVSEISRNCDNFTALRVSGSIEKEDAWAVVNSLPELKHLELCKSYLTKAELMVIMNGCRKLERLSVRNCLGFEADEEVLRTGSGIKAFEHEGSKLLDDSGYETDEPDYHHEYFLLPHCSCHI
ncbi:hypothetical protein C4D60_Mb05t07360 [Musa balbisiana]|uniref:F-box domain-containing protein n=1 Tax=Musa balbisiana TaxID=52838 RepID=A0A4S8JUE6_MUSBA|nr:hypothetical protein C4D60_Mb05t07360 [Musa balbisiana]